MALPVCMQSPCVCFLSEKFKQPLMYNKEDPFQYVSYNKKWAAAYLDELYKHSNKDRVLNTNHYDFVTARDVKTSTDHHVHTLKLFEKFYILNQLNGESTTTKC